MGLFTQLFGELVAFVYHCFDRIVIHGYLTGLSRPDQVAHFFRQVVGVPVITKETLSQRTGGYQSWVEAFARNHRTPIRWAEKGVRKEDYVLPWLRRMVKKDAYGVYFIFKSMEVGPTFRISVPKYPTTDPNYRILANQWSRFTHYYFYIHDEVLGPIVMRVASFFPFRTTYYLNGHNFIEHQLRHGDIGFRKNDNAFVAVDDVAALQAAADKLSPDIIRKRLDYWTFILGPKFSARERKQVKLSRIYAISQVEYCWNIIFKRNFPIHKLFERSCELGLWRLTAHKIAEVFGTRLHRRHRGKLYTIIDQIAHGHHVFRAYFRNAVLRQYEKFSMLLRNELCSNNLYDFRLRKGLEHLDEVRHKFQAIISRFADFQAQWLNAQAATITSVDNPISGCAHALEPPYRGDRLTRFNLQIFAEWASSKACHTLSPVSGSTLASCRSSSSLITWWTCHSGSDVRSRCCARQRGRLRRSALRNALSTLVLMSSPFKMAAKFPCVV